MKGLRWCEQHPEESPGPRTDTGDKLTLKVFEEATAGEFACREICGRTFSSVDEHAAYVDDGGCRQLIEGLAQS